MNYLDYPRHDDSSRKTNLKHAISTERSAIAREMGSARYWQAVRDVPTVRKGARQSGRFVTISVARALEANHRLLNLLREWKEYE